MVEICNINNIVILLVGMEQECFLVPFFWETTHDSFRENDKNKPNKTPNKKPKWLV